MKWIQKGLQSITGYVFQLQWIRKESIFYYWLFFMLCVLYWSIIMYSFDRLVFDNEDLFYFSLCWKKVLPFGMSRSRQLTLPPITAHQLTLPPITVKSLFPDGCFGKWLHMTTSQLSAFLVSVFLFILFNFSHTTPIHQIPYCVDFMFTCFSAIDSDLLNHLDR